MSKNIAGLYAWRFYFLLIMIFLVSFALLFRILYLTVVDRTFLTQQGDARSLRLIETHAYRGIIEDRNGFPLAVSTRVYSVWINPQEFSASPKQLAALAQLIKLSPQQVIKIHGLAKTKLKSFQYLRRGLSPETARQIIALEIPGVYTAKAYKRFYPEGEVTSHLLGFTNIDDQGQEGLELGYNDWLSGTPGKKWVIKDRLNRVIDEVYETASEVPGKKLTLSIDRYLQYMAYRELVQGIKNNKATSGSAVIVHVKTGEILGMVNYPSYNPNNRHGHINAALRNRAITDTFEPGSTIKAFTIASGLESKQYTRESNIDTSPGYMRVDHHLVRDEKNNGVLTLPEILQVSSNVGAAKIALSLQPEHLYKLLSRVGFGEITGIGFPGEQSGQLAFHRDQGAFPIASLSYGYGITVTPLQLARAYTILANKGIKIPLTLLKTDKRHQGDAVMMPQVAQTLLELLETVMKKGSGRLAQIEGYRIAGKSGTARLVGKNGYEHRYIASFVGVAPLSDPQVVVLVVIHDPKGKNYYGGRVSGPIFKQIMEHTLRRLAIQKDASNV